MSSLAAFHHPPPGANATVTSEQETWPARLSLCFDTDPTANGKTRLLSRHQGPLRIQKALYPEGGTPCHAIIVHPPGGIAGGDRLDLDINCLVGSGALITTPGATKWYGSSGSQATQSIHMRVAGALEWMPQEAIIFDHADIASTWKVAVEATGRFFGWDIFVFGRKASGESFRNGRLRQLLEIELDEQLVWSDRLHLRGADALFNSPIGLRGHHAMATCWAVSSASSPWSETDVHDLRHANPGVAWTMLHTRLLVGRALGSPTFLRAQLLAGWSQLRPRLFDRSAISPRIWAT
jgi:urease accessory protein